MFYIVNRVQPYPVGGAMYMFVDCTTDKSRSVQNGATYAWNWSYEGVHYFQ